MRKAVIITLMISLLIAVHESGHLLAARAFNVPAEEFSVGFGPAVVSRQWGDTTFSLRVLPFGGYTKIKPAELQRAKRISQLIIIVSGAFFNAFLAVPLILKRKYGEHLEWRFEKIDERYRWNVMAVVIPLFFLLVGPLCIAWLLLTGKIGYDDMLPHKFYSEYNLQLKRKQEESPDTTVTSVWSKYFGSITVGMATMNMFPLLPFVDGSKVFILMLRSVGTPHAELVQLACVLMFTLIVIVLGLLREYKHS